MRPLPLEGLRQRVCTRVEIYVLTTEVLDTTRLKIVVTSVTFEQENLVSSTKLSFRTIHRASIEKGTYFSHSFPNNEMVLWHDYLIGSFAGPQPRTHGLFLWNMRANSIFHFEVCHTCFPSPSALKPIHDRWSSSHAVLKSLMTSSSPPVIHLMILAGTPHTAVFTYQAL